MESKSIKFSINKDLDVSSNSFDAFISYMEHSNEFWFIKDKNSRFIYMNNYGLYHCGLSKNFNIEGRLDSECPAPWSEFEDVIQENDKNVIRSEKTIPVLNTFVYGGREKIIQPFMLYVTPLIKDDEAIGVVGRATKLEVYSMCHLESNSAPDSISFGKPTDLFTDREFDVVFFALQSLSAKEIARKLNISHNTVENYLHSVYQKIGVSALSQLIEYCRRKGYDKYAPNKFINPNPYIPLA